MLYDLIYSIKLIELKILKIYIMANLVSKFFKIFKLSTDTLILLICKKKSSLYIYINY